ncbi:Protein of unknown function [Bacillus sp. OV322]|uniref:zinc-finger domain-containing protein n=1 Tax=Bacillus sp. OV322 TaxID=1882764 RepID=UPI0008DF2E4D|nr:zinc-finger domain-containing protein [Bacillus sp. OV322]SFC46565.1 Protein of unknown function [Bacillus sp. OV322]
MDRKKVFDDVDEILVSYCKDCFVYKQFRKDKGRGYAHKFCISQCTVGEQLQKAGSRLKNNL